MLPRSLQEARLSLYTVKPHWYASPPGITPGIIVFTLSPTFPITCLFCSPFDNIFSHPPPHLYPSPPFPPPTSPPSATSFPSYPVHVLLLPTVSQSGSSVYADATVLLLRNGQRTDQITPQALLQLQTVKELLSNSWVKGSVLKIEFVVVLAGGSSWLRRVY